jgi:hypothetical protein
MYGKVAVDGNLDEWKTIGAISQYLAERSGPDASYKAIDPFADPANLAEGFLGEFATAWDDENFYYMARVFDPSYEPQISNFKDFDRALFFPYPADFIYRTAGWAGNNSIAIHPKGLYFNIEGNVKGPDYVRHPKDVYASSDWRYRIGTFHNTDYNHVAYDTYHGPELLRTRSDNFFFNKPLPITTDYMRLNCQVPGNKLIVNFDRKTGVVTYEGAIPWSEMKAVNPVPGAQLKLGWMISKGVRDTLEWNTGRSASVLSGTGFAFQGKWSVETPWGLYKAE